MPFLRQLPSERVVRVGFLLLLLAWVFAIGKDFSWDLQNHHLYLPFAWITGRRATDLFAAGPQSYQNPLAYFPFYWLELAKLPSWLIGAILGVAHGLVLWPLDRICRLFWPRVSPEAFWWRLLALAFAASAPAFLVWAGTTSTDPLTSLLVTWAFALTLEPEAATPRLGGQARALLIGALLGLATAAKLSNSVFVLAIGLFWILKVAIGLADWRRLVAGGLGIVVAFAAGAGWWMAWLWQDFGNPVFPLFNNVFHSPEAPAQALITQRFLPTSGWDYLLRIPRMAELTSFVTVEVFSPDLRPLAATIALALLVVVTTVRTRGRALLRRETWAGPGAQLAVLLVFSYVAWLRSSGNSRYAIPLFMLVGIGLVRAVQLLLPLRVARVVLLLVLALQTAFFIDKGDHRFHAFEWDSHPYFDYKVPRRLREEPFLHLTVGSQTDASVAWYFDHRGAMASPIGQFALPTDGPLGDRLKALLAQWRGRTRLLFRGAHLEDPDNAKHEHELFHALLYRFQLDVDWSDCEALDLTITNEDERWVGTPDSREHLIRRIYSCKIVDAPHVDPEYARQEAQARQVFDMLEAACPKVFAPHPMAIDHGVDVWETIYADSDAMLAITKDGVIYQHPRIIDTYRLGTLDDFLSRRVQIHCPELSFETPH